jgi:hypothetical protein
VPQNNFTGQNRSRYQSPELDALVERYYNTIPIPDRMQVLGQIVHYLWVQPISTNWLVDALRPTLNIGHACGLGSEWPSWFEEGVFSNAQVHMEIVCQTPLALLVAVIVALSVLLILASWAINLNKELDRPTGFASYEHSLAPRVATTGGQIRFTGFDPLDNLQMHELHPPRCAKRTSESAAVCRNVAQGCSARAIQCRAMARSADVHAGTRPVARSGGRLRHAEPGTPTLKALQRNLFESLNRVLETARLDQHPEFRAAVREVDRAKYREALQQYVLHGSAIFSPIACCSSSLFLTTSGRSIFRRRRLTS